MLGERIANARKDAGYSDQKSFANAIGVSPRTLADYETNNSEPKASTITRIADICNISPTWLLKGDNHRGLPVTQERPADDDGDTVALNYYPDIIAATGYGAVNDLDTHPQIMKFDRGFLQEFMNIRRFDCIDIIRITGDSMEPYIHDGETVLVERHGDARNGETVIANVNGHIYIKRFHTDPFGRWVKLISDNDEYGDIELEGELLQHFSIVGIVRARIKAF